MLTISHPQRSHLLEFNSFDLTGQQSMVAAYTPKTYKSYWLTLPEVQHFPIGHRVIYDSEIVIECDHPDYTLNARVSNAWAEWLRKEKIPFTAGFSGGKSFHLHVFLDINGTPFNDNMTEYFKRHCIKTRDIRNQFFMHYMYPHLKEIESTFLDGKESKIDLQLLNVNHFIRNFGAKHETTGAYKVHVADFPEQPPIVTDDLKMAELYPPAPVPWRWYQNVGAWRAINALLLEGLKRKPRGNVVYRRRET